ncbi:MAG: aspartate 1-decarboxylase [Verrucomicrobia bacterium]|nr:aspartate 1-decarboxylase [Verrucomicrobiota bacterium]
MQVKVLKSKIHRARVTAANLNYEGSLTVPTDLLERAGMYPYEHVLCGNLSNGARFETYIIPGEPGSGEIALNGAVARLGAPGDILIVMSFTWADEAQARSWKPRVIVLDAQNRIQSERA